jgi:Tfp pilus assembly protein PilX
MMRDFRNYKCSRGFALVVTLSLMILLTIIAVGLLSHSSIALRQAEVNPAETMRGPTLGWPSRWY